MTTLRTRGADRAQWSPRRGTLSPREREVLGLLADGLTGVLIAARLHLAPETVRTHVRNAMAKLGASTRSHAIALALRHGEIDAAGEQSASVGDTSRPDGADLRPRRASRPLGSSEVRATLDGVIERLASLYDVESGAIFVTGDDGLLLRRVALAGRNGGEPFTEQEEIALGQGSIGRVALERRAQVVTLPGADGPVAVVSARTGGRLVAVLCLATRASRPFERNELLLLQTLSSRLAAALATGGEAAGARLREDLEDFRSFWSAPA